MLFRTFPWNQVLPVVWRRTMINAGAVARNKQILLMYDEIVDIRVQILGKTARRINMH